MKDKAEVYETFHVMDHNKLALMENGRGVFVLGYRLELTERECDIVRILIERNSPISKSDIAHMSESAESSIAVHVANINKKAFGITGRKLIVGNRRGEYKISEEM